MRGAWHGRRALYTPSRIGKYARGTDAPAGRQKALYSSLACSGTDALAHSRPRAVQLDYMYVCIGGGVDWSVLGLGFVMVRDADEFIRMLLGFNWPDMAFLFFIFFL